MNAPTDHAVNSYDLIESTARSLFLAENPGVAWEMADGDIWRRYMRRAELRNAGPMPGPDPMVEDEAHERPGEIF